MLKLIRQILTNLPPFAGSKKVADTVEEKETDTRPREKKKN